MNRFKILIARQISKEDLEISFSKNHGRKSTPNMDYGIQKIWEIELNKNPKMFSGLKFRIGRINTEGNIKLCLGLTNYKDHIGTNLSKNVKNLLEKGKVEFGDENAFMANALGNMCIAETSDGKVVFLKRSDSVAEYKGYFDVPGGHPEPKDIGITPDNINYNVTEDKIKDCLFNSIVSELIAETGINKFDIVSVTCIGFVENVELGNKPDMVFYAKLHASSEVIKKKYARAEEGFESTKLIFVDKSKLGEFISVNKITPAAEASISCYNKFVRQHS